MRLVQRGWLRRHWKLFFCVLFVMLILGGISGYLFRFGPILFSQPYREEALDFVVAEPLLSSPSWASRSSVSGLQDWCPSGMITGDADTGESRKSISPVSGPKGRAKVK